jgi:hypothetical protein
VYLFSIVACDFCKQEFVSPQNCVNFDASRAPIQKAADAVMVQLDKVVISYSFQVRTGLAVRDAILEICGVCGDKVLNADACYALNLYTSNILFLDELAPVAAGHTDQAEARLHFCVLFSL